VQWGGGGIHKQENLRREGRRAKIFGQWGWSRRKTSAKWREEAEGGKVEFACRVKHLDQPFEKTGPKNMDPRAIGEWVLKVQKSFRAEGRGIGGSRAAIVERGIIFSKW